jgi:hypothetical protein
MQRLQSTGIRKLRILVFQQIIQIHSFVFIAIRNFRSDKNRFCIVEGFYEITIQLLKKSKLRNFISTNLYVYRGTFELITFI